MSEVAVIFGTQRCGSNFFLSACRRFENLLVFGEMYHRAGAFPFQQSLERDFPVKQDLGRIICTLFQEQAADCFENWNPEGSFCTDNNTRIDKALTQFSHKYPNRYFEALRSMAGDRMLLQKIFPEHLDMYQILSILYEQRPRVILMMRNPLDSFISYKKLVATRKPQDVDTSGLKIHFNRVEYYAYKANLIAYLTAIRNFCEDEWLDISTIHYEWLHNMGSEGKIENKIEKVKRSLEKVFRVPMQEIENAESLKLFKKQDKFGSAAEKVLNPEQLPKTPQQLTSF